MNNLVEAEKKNIAGAFALVKQTYESDSKMFEWFVWFIVCNN